MKMMLFPLSRRMFFAFIGRNRGLPMENRMQSDVQLLGCSSLFRRWIHHLEDDLQKFLLKRWFVMLSYP